MVHLHRAAPASRIRAAESVPDELADRLVAALALRQIGGPPAGSRGGSRCGEVKNCGRSRFVYSVFSAGYRAANHQDHDRDVLLEIPVTALALDVPVDSARMNCPAQATRDCAAFGMESMDEIA